MCTYGTGEMIKTKKRLRKRDRQVCPESVAVEAGYVELVPWRVQDLAGK